eukprot:1158801-Pelagomonas_calceolata.AAC.3
MSSHFRSLTDHPLMHPFGVKKTQWLLRHRIQPFPLEKFQHNGMPKRGPSAPPRASLDEGPDPTWKPYLSPPPLLNPSSLANLKQSHCTKLSPNLAWAPTSLACSWDPSYNTNNTLEQAPSVVHAPVH